MYGAQSQKSQLTARNEVQIGNNIIITLLTEIMKKKEIATPYLLHTHAAEGMSFEGVCLYNFNQLHRDVIKLWLKRGR